MDWRSESMDLEEIERDDTTPGKETGGNRERIRARFWLHRPAFRSQYLLVRGLAFFHTTLPPRDLRNKSDMGINRATVGLVHHSDPSPHIGAQILHHSSPFRLQLFVFVLQYAIEEAMQGQNLDMFVDALLLNSSLHVLRSGSEDAREERCIT
ncbi:hypothetical protein SDJN02_25447, partial [Cucurbita argyrosperma subsp. argyrosperma]